MVRLEPERRGGIAHALEPLRPKDEIIPERMETDRARSLTGTNVEPRPTAITLKWEKLRGEEGNGMERLMHIPDEMEDPTQRHGLGRCGRGTPQDVEVRLVSRQDVLCLWVHRLY